jgi:hypothetical protein
MDKKTVTCTQLALGLIRDLICEIRTARKYGQTDFAVDMEEKVMVLYQHRHTTRFNHYGWPDCIAP